MNYEVITVKEFKARASFYINEMRNGKIFEVNYVKIGNVQLLNQGRPEVDHPKVDYSENVDYIEELPTERCDACGEYFSSGIYRVYEEQGEMNICRNCVALKVPPKMLESTLKKMESIF